MPLTGAMGRLMIATKPLPRPARVLGTFGIVAAFSLLRVAADPIWPSGYPFIFAIVAVLLSAALFNDNCGFLATVLTAAFAMLWYFHPFGPLAVTGRENVLAVAAYIVVGFLASTLIDTLHNSLSRVAEAQRYQTEMLREFRHRTRNDLQSVIGLLLLRAKATQSEELRKALKEAAQHAMALARVHTRLADATPGDGQHAVVDTRRFICGVCSDIERARQILIHCVAESHVLNTERGVQIGLLLNELLTGEEAKVRFLREDGQFILIVAGAGALDQPLTIRFVQGLAQQLRGTVLLSGDAAELRFPVVPLAK